MYKTVSKWLGHTICNTFVSLTVTCGNNYNIVWQFVCTNLAVKDKLICSRLYSRCSTIKLVQEQKDSIILCGKFFTRKFCGRRPFHSVVICTVVWNTFDICRFPKRQTYINKQTVCIFITNAGNQIRFTNSWRTPNHHRTFLFSMMLNILAGFT